MMNFSAFGGPFSGIHQIAAKFGHETQNGTSLDVNNGGNGNGSSNGDGNSQRYHNNVNGFVQNDTSAFNQQILQNVNQSWQSLANTGNTTVDYSSHLLPISIQHFLKYSETIKKESSGIVTSPLNAASLSLGPLDGNNLNLKSDDGKSLRSLPLPATSITVVNNDAYSGLNCIDGAFAHDIKPTASGEGSVAGTASATPAKKSKKKKAALKEKKPRPKPGEIRETKALDGSALFCCPECQMAYSDRSLIEQHVISHAVERRFVCDVCNAALKRKDHLTRHKLSHIPDRPHVCNICMKSFKRKEQLTLHIVIHSGEKKHVCQECGKGFYRKDHLRKHTRSHIARRVKSEVSSHNETTTKPSTQGS